MCYSHAVISHSCSNDVGGSHNDAQEVASQVQPGVGRGVQRDCESVHRYRYKFLLKLKQPKSADVYCTCACMFRVLSGDFSTAARWLSQSVQITRHNHGDMAIELAHELQTFADVLLLSGQLRQCHQVARECRDIMRLYYEASHERRVDLEQVILQTEAARFPAV